MNTNTTVNLTSDDMGETMPAVGILPPTRLRREYRPKSALTDEALIKTLKSGRLTRRDLQVVELVWWFGTLQTHHIQQLAFYTLGTAGSAGRTTRRRLQYLYEAYLLDRVWFSLNDEPVYILDLLGARLICRAYEKKGLKQIAWSAAEQSRMLLFLKHRLEVAEFAVQAAVACREHQGQLQWRSEAFLRYEYTDPAAKKRILIPDGLATITLKDKPDSFSFFLEWDRATETHQTLAQKFNVYALCQRRDIFKNVFKSTPPLVLVVTPSRERVANILAAIGQVFGRWNINYKELQIFVTDQATYRASGLWGKSWFYAGTRGIERLKWGEGVQLPVLTISNNGPEELKK